MKFVLPVLVFVHVLAVTAICQQVKSTPMDLFSAVQSVATAEFDRGAIVVNIVFVGDSTSEFDLNTGQADSWFFSVYSGTLDSIAIYYADMDQTLGPFIFEVYRYGDVQAYEKTELVRGWVDSPIALNGAKAGGADAFLLSRPDAIVEFVALAESEWEFIFTSRIDTLACLVNAANGISISCDIITRFEDVRTIPELLTASVSPQPVHIGSSRAPVVHFSLPTASRYSIVLYDALGRNIATLDDGYITAGDHVLELSERHFPQQGLYLVRIQTERSVRMLKLIVTR